MELTYNWIHKKPNTVFQTQGLYFYPCVST